jgi:hypothetical protein
MNYNIEALEYDTHVVVNDDGRCFEGTLLHCEEYIKAVRNAARFMSNEDSDTKT